MRKKFLHFAVSLAAVFLAVSIFTVFFEIAEDDKYFLPSGEALENEYLALDRWLAASGRKVRVKPYANLETLKAAAERTILIQQDLFDWSAGAAEYLEAWVENGGALILCLDYYGGWDGADEPGAFLGRLGLESGEEAEDLDFNFNSRFPSYGRNISFKDPEKTAALALKDENNLVRLVEYERGKGKIIVTGRPRFMSSANLNEEANARLSWYLFAGDGNENQRGDGILFIRGKKRTSGAVGRVFREGNFIIIIISALVLVAAGFWSVIPVFGVVKDRREKPGKTLAGRFLAEGLFLRRFGVLDIYRAAYFREIRRRLVKTENLAEDEIIPRAASIWASGGDGISAAGKALSPGRKKGKDFLKSITILKTILERL